MPTRSSPPFFSSFIISYEDDDGTTCYGIATTTGFWSFTPPSSDVDVSKCLQTLDFMKDFAWVVQMRLKCLQTLDFIS
ncbi:hypothetical protein LXL04_005246 [Taraxacum kok-saghyz]